MRLPRFIFPIRLGFAPAVAALLMLQACPALATAAPQWSCKGVGIGMRIGDAIVVSTERVPAGSHKGPFGGQVSLPEFCRVVAIAKPTPASNIVIEIGLPAITAWNGKILGLGNGGSAGSIPPGALDGGMALGYAVADTDMGSYPGDIFYVGFSALIGRPEAIRDFGYRATHEMTVLTKEIVQRHYGHAAQRAYFVGGSTGGQQALSEAQRYPDDYDGILAEDPAEDRTHLHVRFAALRRLGDQPGAAMSAADWQLWHRTILKACVGKDGGAPGDAFLTNPLQCSVSPKVLLCKRGQDPATCLRTAQIRALTSIYDGTRDPRTHQLIYFADVRGAEQQIAMIYGEGFFSQNFDITHWVLPPGRTGTGFDFDHDVALLDAKYAADVNAMSPDLSRFAAHGGKLILFHGLADGLISPLDTLDYYRRITARGHDKRDFVRLFLAPGVEHILGGPGPDAVGQIPGIRPGTRGPGTPENDLLAALDRWSESGVAPNVVIAGKYKEGPFLKGNTNDEVPVATRPLCAYPQFARYDGRGDPSMASSFTCAMSPPPHYERPAKQYLK